jgi:hypothetical protein
MRLGAMLMFIGAMLMFIGAVKLSVLLPKVAGEEEEIGCFFGGKKWIIFCLYKKYLYFHIQALPAPC